MRLSRPIDIAATLFAMLLILAGCQHAKVAHAIPRLFEKPEPGETIVLNAPLERHRASFKPAAGQVFVLVYADKVYGRTIYHPEGGGEMGEAALVKFVTRARPGRAVSIIGFTPPVMASNQ